MAKLKRSLGLFELTLYGVGIILGAGIYALIGKAAGLSGNSLWLSFLIGAIIASLTGLSYCELGSIFPKEAAEYVYVKKALGKNIIPFIIGWLTIVTGTIASATVALGFGGYLSSFTGINQTFGAISIILIFSFLNYLGIKQSAKANIVFTLIEAAGLLIIIFLGVPYFGSVNYFEFPNGFSGVFAAAVLVFFAYIGFEDIVNLSEETKNPRKNIPKAIILSVIITTVIYILVAISSVSILPWDSLSMSNAPLSEVAEAAFPGSSIILTIIALFATANTVLILLIVDSRMLWGMSREGEFPKFLSEIHKKTRTPWKSILTITCLAVAFVLYGNIRTIAEVTDFGAFLIFLSVNFSVIVLRFKYKKKRPFKVPINIGNFPVLPFLGLIFSLYMMTHFSLRVVLIGMATIVVGLIFYFLKKIKL